MLELHTLKNDNSSSSIELVLFFSMSQEVPRIQVLYTRLISEPENQCGSNAYFFIFFWFFVIELPYLGGGEAKPQEFFLEKDVQWLDKNGRK